jgi:hypothetical protein
MYLRTVDGVDSLDKLRLRRTAFEPLDHLRLDIHGYHPAGRTDSAREFECKEPHSWSGFENRHPLTDIRGENARGVMLKTANRADEQISEPPGTNAMFTLHHRDRMGCGGACLLRLRAKERPDILLKYSLSKYSLNLALLGYAAQRRVQLCSRKTV